MEARFLVLPVAVRPAGIPIVLDVEDGNVGPVENALAFIVNKAQLYSRAVGSRGCTWTD